MTEIRRDLKTFHEADYDDYEAMLDGLAETFWDKLNPSGEQSTPDASTVLLTSSLFRQKSWMT